MRLAITYRVAQAWRAPIFRRLCSIDDFKTCVFHGEDIAGTKFVNTTDFRGINHFVFPTRSRTVKVGGRPAHITTHHGVVTALREFNPDVILAEGASNFLTNFSVLRYAKSARRPVVLWSLGQETNRRRSPLSQVFLKVQQWQEYRCFAFLGYSEQAREYFLQRGFSSNRCFVAHNCVDTEAIDEHLPKARIEGLQLRAELGWTNNKVVLFVGSLIATKSIDRLLHAFHAIHKSEPETRLLIVGGGNHESTLRNLATSLGIDSVTHFTGPVWDGVDRYFQAADLFVLPGLGGLAVSHAMAHSLPVISGPADGTEKDLVTDGKNGYLLGNNASEQQAVAELSHLIKETIRSRHRLSQMGQYSRDLIDTKINTKSYVDAIIHCVNQVKSMFDEQSDQLKA